MTAPDVLALLDADDERAGKVGALAGAATEGPWEETWKPIPGFDGYDVSDCGNVRSYYRRGNHKEKWCEFPRTLALRARADGAYPSVQLPDPDGAYRSRVVHRLVMLTFVGPCPEGQEVAHLNGDPSDNRLSNLAYVSHRENESHKVLHGTKGVGERNSNARLQGWQVAEIKYLAGKSVPQTKIAALFGIDCKQVSEILRGRTWKDEPARTETPWLVERLRARDEAIGIVLAWIDRRGVYVGDEDSEYYRGYRQAQREAIHDADDLRAALASALGGGEQQ